MKKVKTPTYIEVVKQIANKDMGEKITTLEEIKTNLLRDSLTQAYETFCETYETFFVLPLFNL